VSDETRIFLAKYILEDVETSLQQQSVSLHNLRVRASYLLTFSIAILGVFVSILGGPSSTANLSEMLSLPEILAISCAIISAVLCLFILVPHSGWIFSHSQKAFLAEYVYVDAPLDTVDVIAKISIAREDHFNRNKTKLDGLHSAYFFAAIAILFQLFFWIFGRL
jgi:hypothetical protein